VSGVNGRPEKRKHTPFGIEVDPAVRGDGCVVLGQRAEETIEMFEPESCVMHLVQGGQDVTDRSPVVGCSILRRALGQRLGRQEETVIEGHEAGPDGRGRGDSCSLSQENQAAQFGLEHLASKIAHTELREHRERVAVEYPARMGCPVVQVGERIARPASSEMAGCCALNSALDVRFEERVSSHHEPNIMAPARGLWAPIEKCCCPSGWVSPYAG